MPVLEGRDFASSYMPKAVIIHGTKGSPDGNWFKWLAAELESRGFRTIVPRFPTPEGQSLDSWLKRFASIAGELDENSLVIGHSVGAVFVLRLLERLAKPLRAAVLAAGFTGALGLPEYDALNATFVEEPFNWEKIRANAKDILCLSGQGDPYVPFEQGKEIADKLQVRHVVIPKGGHLNAEFGLTSFPRLMQELEKALSKDHHHESL
jgi:uncharacterized protein